MSGRVPGIVGERRRHERLVRSYKVRYRHMDDLVSRGGRHEGVILDISGGGLRFLSLEPVEENSQLVMEVEFSGWTTANGEWVATRDSSDTARLEVLALVTHRQVSQEVPGRYEIGVRFCGRVWHGEEGPEGQGVGEHFGGQR